MKHKHNHKSYKQCILVRKDLKMSAGKTASQTAHASVEAVFLSDKQKVNQWKDNGMKKVVLAVQDEEELIYFKKQADKSGLLAVIITDAGRTEIPPSTATCMAIGPDSEDKIDRITGKLKSL